MRILHLAHCYPPAVGGSEHVISAWSERLVRDHGHDVTVVTTTGYNTDPFNATGIRTMTPGEELRNGVLVRRHQADPRASRYFGAAARRTHRYRLPGNSLLRIVADGPRAPGMLSDACRIDADVIAATAFPLLHMYFAFAAAAVRRVPLVVIGALHPDDTYGFDRWPMRRVISRADGYVAYTEYERQCVIGYGLRADRAHVIAPGVDRDAFAGGDGLRIRAQLGIDAASPVVGFLGQLGAHKGIGALVAAMPAVWTAVPDAHLLIAGANTAYVDQLRAQIAAVRHRGRISLLVDVPGPQRCDVLAAFDVFASPSSHESFGLTYAEAWSAGLPVVGCRIGAVESVVDHGEDGLLTGVGSVHEIAGSLVELLLDPELRRAFADHGARKVAERFSWTTSTATLDALYRGLAGGG